MMSEAAVYCFNCHNYFLDYPENQLCIHIRNCLDLHASAHWDSVKCFFCDDTKIRMQSASLKFMHIKECGDKHGVTLEKLCQMFVGKAHSMKSEQTVVQISDDENENDSGISNEVCKKSELSSSSSTMTTATSETNHTNNTSDPTPNAFTILMNTAKRLISPIIYKSQPCSLSSVKKRRLESGVTVISADDISANGSMNSTTSSLAIESSVMNQPVNNNDSNRKQQAVPHFKLIKTGNMKKPIVIDGFRYSSKDLSDCYFLTHFHSDHYTGLTKKFNAGKIYCSQTTASLASLKLGLNPNLFVPLALNVTHTIPVGDGDRRSDDVKGNLNSKPNADNTDCIDSVKESSSINNGNDNNNNTTMVNVTLVDANHCPGAVCLIIQCPGYSEIIFHTGDFRYIPQMLNQSPALQSLARNSNNSKDLVVYLDTTYCNPSHTFPSQDIAIQAIVNQVLQLKNDEKQRLQQQNSEKSGQYNIDSKDHSSSSSSSLKSEKYFINYYIFGAYGIGKERVYMSVAEALNCQVHVERLRYQSIACYSDWSRESLDRITTLTPDNMGSTYKSSYNNNNSTSISSNSIRSTGNNNNNNNSSSNNYNSSSNNNNSSSSNNNNNSNSSSRSSSSNNSSSNNSSNSNNSSIINDGEKTENAVPRVWVTDMGQINFRSLQKLKEKIMKCRNIGSDNSNSSNSSFNNNHSKKNHGKNSNFYSASAIEDASINPIRIVAFLPTGWSHDSGSRQQWKQSSSSSSSSSLVASHNASITNVTIKSSAEDIISSSSHNTATNTATTTTTTTGNSNNNRSDSSSSSTSSSSILIGRYNDNGDCIYSVPYSEHSSFTELVDFIQTFRPHAVIPTVNTASPYQVDKQLKVLLQACRSTNSNTTTTAASTNNNNNTATNATTTTNNNNATTTNNNNNTNNYNNTANVTIDNNSSTITNENVDER